MCFILHLNKIKQYKSVIDGFIYSIVCIQHIKTYIRKTEKDEYMIKLKDLRHNVCKKSLPFYVINLHDIILSSAKTNQDKLKDTIILTEKIRM